MPRRQIIVAAGLLLAATCQSALANEPPRSEPPVPPAVDAGPSLPSPLAQEFSARLAVDGAKLSPADRSSRAALASFYEKRQHEPVWIGSTGLNAAGQAVIAEIGRAADWGLDPSAFSLPALPPGEISPAARAEAETTLSLAVLKYARHARGGRTDPVSLSKYLDRQPELLDPNRVIEEAASSASPDAYLRGLHPQHPQFERLRQKYLAARVAQSGTAAADEESKPADKGKRRAGAGGTEAAPIRKLLVNMEQWRWMPPSLGDFYVWVNIPEFTLRVVKNGKVIHTERVIVGKTDTQTPIFSDEMEQVIFHPFWGVPDSIKQNEILPSLAQGSTRLLERHNLRIQYRGRDIDPEGVNWEGVDMRNFHVYQPPGEGNVLGVVKFRFPNKHDVYMHDTPTKNLFNAGVRAFSHGCVRVREPLKFAELLLAEDKGWPASRVASAVRSGTQDNQVNLTHKFPVHITYFTATVESDGKLNTFADLYGHEGRIALGLEGKAHLIARAKEERGPVRAAAASRLAETRRANSKNDLVRQLFGN